MAAYFLAADLDPDPPSLVVAVIDSETIAFRFPRRAKAAAAMDYHLEESDDLMHWRRLNSAATTTVTTLTAEVDEVTVELPRGGAFLRLSIELR